MSVDVVTLKFLITKLKFDAFNIFMSFFLKCSAKEFMNRRFRRTTRR